MAGDKLFKTRHPHTRELRALAGEEWELYDAVTDFVSKKLARDPVARRAPAQRAGFALTTMQRRLASSTRAIRRTLERRIERIERALEDPEAYLRSRRRRSRPMSSPRTTISKTSTRTSCWQLEEEALEEWLPRRSTSCEANARRSSPLLALAQEVEAEAHRAEAARAARRRAKSEGLHEDRRKQLLIFTEHKDTLDYLVEKLGADFDVAVIHGGMKLAERIDQERFFREQAQIMVATEAAGEGINLQFCHLMVNYDIPWNPNRLEQRMGRIHRIGQTREVHIFNLVAGNTREGYVLKALLDKIENIEGTLGDEVFDVIGGIFAEYNLRELLESVLVGEVSAEERSRADRGEGERSGRGRPRERAARAALATDNIDWQEQSDRAARARERRLPPSYFERFFLDAIAFAGGKAERAPRRDRPRRPHSRRRSSREAGSASATRRIAPDLRAARPSIARSRCGRASEDEADAAAGRAVRAGSSALRRARRLGHRAHRRRHRSAAPSSRTRRRPILRSSPSDSLTSSTATASSSIRRSASRSSAVTRSASAPGRRSTT